MSMEPILKAMHQLCGALHMDCIDPAEMEVHLPHDAWWRLWTRIEAAYGTTMKFDGRGALPVQFQFMGIVYKVKR